MTSPFYLVNENHLEFIALLIELNKIIIIVNINSSDCIIDNGLEIKEKNNYYF